MEFFEKLAETWQDPNMRHAAMVHFPIVLGMLGVAVALVAAIWGGRRAGLRWLAVGTYAVLAVAAWLTQRSGDAADHEVGSDLSTAARELLHEHEELGEKAWFFALITAAVLILTFVRKPAIRRTVAWLGVLAALTTAGWIGATAQHGGEAVYKFGAGTDVHASAVPPAPAAGSFAPASSPSADARMEHYRTTVRPLIDKECLRCHDEVKRKASLVQTTVAGLLKGGKSGPAIIPGKPEDSLMHRKITHPDNDEVMPPDGRLPAAQIAAIERWIRDGAVGE